MSKLDSVIRKVDYQDYTSKANKKGGARTSRGGGNDTLVSRVDQKCETALAGDVEVISRFITFSRPSCVMFLPTATNFGL